jgi:hypothetical protein
MVFLDTGIPRPYWCWTAQMATSPKQMNITDAGSHRFDVSPSKRSVIRLPPVAPDMFKDLEKVRNPARYRLHIL